MEISRPLGRNRVRMDEALLVQLAREGRESAIEELFGRVWPLVWHWAFAITGDRTLADHVAQDAIYRAFGSLDRFEPGRPLRPWLKRITVNTAIDEVRRERKQESVRAILRVRDALDTDRGEHSDVIAAVRALPSRQRIVIALYYWLDCPVEEIASILNIPVGTVASRMNRARSALRDEMEAHLER